MLNIFKITASKVLILSGAVFFVSFFTQCGDSLAKLDERVRLLNAGIDSLRLVENRLLYEKFIAESEKNAAPIPIFGIKSFDPYALFDTVPEIKVLREKWVAANRICEDILEGYPKYAEMQKRFINAKTGPEKEELSRQMSSFSKNLMVNHDEFSEAIGRRVRALTLQYAAIMRFLLEQYQARGEIFPYEWLIQ